MKKWLGILFIIIATIVVGIALYLYTTQNYKLETRNSKLETKTQNFKLLTSNSEPRTLNSKLNDTTTKEQNFQLKLYNLINAYRKERNLSPLLVFPQLELSAKLKLNDMITNNYWQHQDNSNRPPWQFFAQANYSYTKAGENLGFNQKSAFSVFDAWTKSKKHNEQLLNPIYEHMGLAVDCKLLKKTDPNAGCIVVLHLGKK